MVESIIVWVVVGIAAVLVGRSLFRKVRGRETCSCDATCSCQVASSCQMGKQRSRETFFAAHNEPHHNPVKSKKI